MSTMADKTARQVGGAVKAAREAQKLTLRALAAKSGISASMISDVERGAKSPTISTLAVLAGALGLAMSALVEAAKPAPGRIQVVRGSARPALIDPATGARRQSFGSAPRGSKVEFLRYAVPPRVTAGPFAAHARGTIEHIHVAAGAVRVAVGDEAVRLEAGDSCSCLADVPHLFDNADGDAEALIYLVVERR